MEYTLVFVRLLHFTMGSRVFWAKYLNECEFQIFVWDSEFVLGALISQHDFLSLEKQGKAVVYGGQCTQIAFL